MTALSAFAGCFHPLPAASITVAARSLREAGAQRYGVVTESSFWPTQARLLFRDKTPERVVLIKSGTNEPQPRAQSDPPMATVDRDTPWRVIAGLLTAGVQGIATPSFRLDTTPGAAQPNSGGSSNAFAADEQRLASLTRRERQVLELVASGASVRECAAALDIAESTVDNHKSRLMKKVGVRKSSELVRFAFRVGIAR